MPKCFSIKYDKNCLKQTFSVKKHQNLGLNRWQNFQSSSFLVLQISFNISIGKINNPRCLLTPQGCYLTKEIIFRKIPWFVREFFFNWPIWQFLSIFCQKMPFFDYIDQTKRHKDAETNLMELFIFAYLVELQFFQKSILIDFISQKYSILSASYRKVKSQLLVFAKKIIGSTILKKSKKPYIEFVKKVILNNFYEVVFWFFKIPRLNNFFGDEKNSIFLCEIQKMPNMGIRHQNFASL